MSKMTLFENAFSPFARKVRMVLEHKGLAFDPVDGLHRSGREALEKVNPRREVPVLVDGGTVVVNSAHIVAYLEDAYPAPPVLPGDASARARIRDWERLADTLLDAIVVDVSLWSWANRHDTAPAGLREAAARDLEGIFRGIEEQLAHGGEFLCGPFSLADIALFPNLYATRTLNLGPHPARFPRTVAWLKGLAKQPLFQADLARVRACLASLKDNDGLERDRIFWRGDRIEWLLANGFHRWFLQEIEQGRVLWPGTSAHRPGSA